MVMIENTRFVVYLIILIVAFSILICALLFLPVFGQHLTIIKPDRTDNLENEATIQNLSILFENGTIVSLNDTMISQDRGDYIVGIVNIVLSGVEEDELPQYSIAQLEDLLATEQAELEDAEEEIIEENPDDNNDDTEDNGGDDPEDPPDNNTDPIEEPPFESGGGGEFAILTNGCFGGGYYANDPDPKCYPIEDGELKTDPPEEDTATCTAIYGISLLDK